MLCSLAAGGNWVGAAPLENMFLTELREPQPLTKYCITMPMMLDITQYSASPLGKLRVKKANISGMSHCNMLFMDCCLGSAVGMTDIFCIIHIEAATRTGSMKYLSG